MIATLIVIAVLVACAGVTAWARGPVRSRSQRATALEHYRRDLEADQS